jgi:hypothetical protein
MQQQIQIRQSSERCLAEAIAFFARRRAKVSDRTERGLRFGLEGSGSDEWGRVTVAPGAGGATTVTVEAEGLGVMAIAEGFIRELRKQARDADRLSRDAGRAGASLSAGFADLRQRLGMPEPAPPPPAPESPAPTSPPPAPAARPAPPPEEAPAAPPTAPRAAAEAPVAQAVEAPESPPVPPSPPAPLPSSPAPDAGATIDATPPAEPATESPPER